MQNVAVAAAAAISFGKVKDNIKFSCSLFPFIQFLDAFFCSFHSERYTNWCSKCCTHRHTHKTVSTAIWIYTKWKHSRWQWFWFKCYRISFSLFNLETQYVWARASVNKVNKILCFFPLLCFIRFVFVRCGLNYIRLLFYSLVENDITNT